MEALNLKINAIFEESTSKYHNLHYISGQYEALTSTSQTATFSSSLHVPRRQPETSE